MGFSEIQHSQEVSSGLGGFFRDTPSRRGGLQVCMGIAETPHPRKHIRRWEWAFDDCLRDHFSS